MGNGTLRSWKGRGVHTHQNGTYVACLLDTHMHSRNHISKSRSLHQIDCLTL